ncbi:MAG TPA: cyclic nucleotide-binding domain-containing protein [Anaerolineaceae bacterium]|nr:cyclic nucleotide-binding domain-containing protein [Anaerolineaceae bacterium]HPN52330.1 cyclic nucleotide-binding domain-containing protein [Anaerolineaceae bacterium]
MPVEQAQIIALLKNIHLFRRLADAEVEKIAAQFEPVALSDGQILFKQGDPAESFYIILNGKVKITRRRQNQVRQLATLIKGDYFGEEALITHSSRSATITAIADSTLLRLSHEDFEDLITRIPMLKANLVVAVTSRHLFRETPLDWLNKEEVVYVMARQHTLFMWQKMAWPLGAMLFGVAAILSLYTFVLPAASISLMVLLALWVLGTGAWTAWNYADWANDYYIVTNQRVVYVEKVLALYDSRQEAPLGTVLSVGVESSQVGRMFRYGDVIVRTFTGPIRLERVPYPEQLASMIEEYWTRARVGQRQDDAAFIEKSIRGRIDSLTGGRLIGGGAPRPAPPKVVQPGPLQVLLSHFFMLRYEEGGAITYRKHWLILLAHVWRPTLIFLLALALVIIKLLGYLPWLPAVVVGIVTVPALLAAFAWWTYEYMDWSNDIYRVTGDQIFDIERKPFAKEEKKTAPLESILSIEYQRDGLAGLVFNFGTVYISVGGAKFSFNYVFNPSAVQQDIYRRMAERVAKKKRAELEAEQDRLSEWFAVYHRGFVAPGQKAPPAGKN